MIFFASPNMKNSNIGRVHCQNQSRKGRRRKAEESSSIGKIPRRNRIVQDETVADEQHFTTTTNQRIGVQKRTTQHSTRTQESARECYQTLSAPCQGQYQIITGIPGGS
jgi:hypothetical protein